MTATGRYTPTAILLHWLIALGLVATFAVGAYMADLEGITPIKLKLFNWHKWAGMSLLLLAVVRLLWRLTHRPPADLPMPAWQTRAAHGMHGLMYALFFAIPLAGWASSSAQGYPVVWFGVLPLPDWVPKDKALGDRLEDLHGTLAWALAALVIAHVAAALKHHFVDRDGLLDRMRFGRG